jgi:molybdopterin-guanine dinucleotide biosynthesis protein A
VVLSGDLPFVRRSHVTALVAALGRADAVLAVDSGGRVQPLLAAYRVSSLSRALPAAPQGTPMRAVLRALPVMRELVLPGEPPPWFDCDTPEQLATARLLAGGAVRPA